MFGKMNVIPIAESPAYTGGSGSSVDGAIAKFTRCDRAPENREMGPVSEGPVRVSYRPR